MIDDAEEELCCLRISRPQFQRGRQVEDAAGALDRRPHGGGRVEEVHLEQPEPRVRAVQGQQVLRLALIICKREKIKIHQEHKQSRSISSGAGSREAACTEVLDGGVDGVAAVEEEADEPGADEAAAARHADEMAAAAGTLHSVVDLWPDRVPLPLALCKPLSFLLAMHVQ